MSLIDRQSLPRDVSRAPIQQDDNAITDHLEATFDLEHLVIPPNVEDGPAVTLAERLMRVVNTNGCRAHKSWVGSKVIYPGYIGIILNNGVVQVVSSGRWMVLSPRAGWDSVHSLTKELIHVETLTIVRVPKSFYGTAMDGGRPVLLGEGVHVRNSRLFEFVGNQAVDQKHLHHGTIHLLRVPIGEYALVIENNVPKILKQGRYVIDSNYFEMTKFVDVNQDHIQHHTLHIIRVPKGKVALVTNNNKPMLLPEGTYTFNAQVFTFSGLRDVNDAVIQHGTITRFRVRNGEIGMAWDNNKPVFIEKPDFYEVDSANFNFVNCVNASEKMIVLGSCKRIIVYDGEVGVSYVNGKLDILQPNTHLFDAVERIFSGFLSTKQQVIQLLHPGSKEQILRCDTKDFVEVGIKAAVFYRISDPGIALLRVGNENAIQQLIRETSIATLQGIMRSSALNQVALSRVVHAAEKADEGISENKPTGPLFFDRVHDDFILRLHDNFKALYGIEISNIRIESFKIINQELSDNISKQAIITAQTETKLANLESQREIATAEQERDAAVARIKVQATALQLTTTTQARNQATLANANAKAQALKIEAQGASDALLTRATSEAKAIEMKAAAEKKRAQDLSATTLGEQLALLNVQSEMVNGAMKGVSKVVYLPPGANSSGIPIQMYGQVGRG